jgi:hypothetical protein
MYLRTLEQLLEQTDWSVAALEMDIMEDVFVQLIPASELKVSSDLTPERVVENLQLVLSSPQYTHLKPGNFEYIDLRFGNRVFVNEFGAPALDDAAAADTLSEVGEDEVIEIGRVASTTEIE